MNHAKGYFMVLGGGVCWATTGLFGTVLFRHGIDPLLVASGRLVIAALFFLLLLTLKYRSSLALHISELPRLLFFGFVGVAVFNICYLQAINLLGVSVAVVLLYTAPAFVIVISRILLKEMITPIKVTALFLTIAGVVLVAGMYDPGRWILDLQGIVLGLCAGLTFALITIFSKIALRHHSDITVTFYFIVIGAVFLSFLRPPWLLLQEGFSPATFLSLLALGFVSTFLAYLLYVGGIKYLEAGRASIVAAVEPVAAFSLAALFLGERLVPLQFVGFSSVVVAVLLLVYKR